MGIDGAARGRRPHLHAEFSGFSIGSAVVKPRLVFRVRGNNALTASRQRAPSPRRSLQALSPAPLSPAAAREAGVLGWAIEWLQAFFLIADDIMDASLTRRGAPCWYKRADVGMTAINDAFIVQAQMYRLLKRHFGGAPFYGALLDLFLDTTWRTELGQNLDLTSQPPPGAGAGVDLERFTAERYRLIVLNKTAYYSFHLPVCCGLLLAGRGAAAAAPAVARVTLLMGEYFQVQDDVLDCFADAAVLGKVGTDIEDAKCSWLVVQALAAAQPEQRAALKAAYGRADEASVAAVKALYRALALEARFDEYERATHAELVARIAAAEAESGVPSAVFTAFLAKISGRIK
jgi:farnesyl diphosphate synthase